MLRRFLLLTVAGLMGLALFHGLRARPFPFLPLLAQAQSTTAPILVRHAPQLGGRIDGNVQQLTGEDLTIKDGLVLTGDLLVPGTPSVIQEGSAKVVGIVDGPGSPNPSQYRVTLSGNLRVNRVIRRTDPVELPAVLSPAQPKGVRDVVVSSDKEALEDFGTLRNLTLTGNAGRRVVPPGTYGDFSAMGNTNSLVLGVPGRPNRRPTTCKG